MATKKKPTTKPKRSGKKTTTAGAEPAKAAAKKAAAKKAAPKKAAPKNVPTSMSPSPLDEVRLTAVFAVSPERLYDAWLDGAEHEAFTGGAASVEAEVGGRHTAWDGYIEGTNLELERPWRIVQSWRTSEFPEGAGDSRVEVLLLPEGSGTQLVLHHTSIPEGQGSKYESGWEEHYFAPMRRYFTS